MASLADQVRADLARFRAQAERNLQDAAELLDEGLKETLGTPYPPASRPGAAPRRRTGDLQRLSIAKANPGSGTITLSNSAEHAKYLRDGTSRMAPRPWEEITLDRLGSQVEEILLDRGYREALKNG